MGANSSIEWTDHTFNPWRGCTKVSPGCEHCYAESLSKRTGHGEYKRGVPRERMSANYWKAPLKWNRDAMGSFQQVDMRDGTFHRGTIEEMAALKLNVEDIRAAYPAHPRVFCASLSDWLDDEVSTEWLADLLKLIHDTPNLDWLLLTKRPQNWASRINAAYHWWGEAHHRAEVHHSASPLTRDDFCNIQAWLSNWLGGHEAPRNVWLGTTVEDQTRADQRIPELLKIPAKVRFLSCEPLLGAVDISKWLNIGQRYRQTGGLDSPWVYEGWHPQPEPTIYTREKIHQVIGGFESGPGARPGHPNWARSLRDQCQAAGVSFFWKQWGEWREGVLITPGTKYPTVRMGEHGRNTHFIENCTEDMGQEVVMERVGKKAAGRLLDGREWNEFPK
jgi:protein gp37